MSKKENLKNCSRKIMKKILTLLIILIILAGLWLGVRFIIGGPEDSWLCVNGEWTKHGAPSAPMPTKPCGEKSVACAMDAKECPDGSYVGRTPPNCDFAPCPETKTVKLYYYNPRRDKDEAGNTKCSRDGLVAIARKIPVSKTPIQNAVNLLLKGKENLSKNEMKDGISTEYPLTGFSLRGASLKNGVLTLEFTDPQNKTVGGACRVGILWFQIEATAKQFPEVKQVRFQPEEIFQP